MLRTKNNDKLDSRLGELLKASDTDPDPVRMDSMQRSLLAAADDQILKARSTSPWLWFSAAAAVAVVIAIFMIGPVKLSDEENLQELSPIAAIADDPDALASAVMLLEEFADDEQIPVPFFDEASEVFTESFSIYGDNDDTQNGDSFSL